MPLTPTSILSCNIRRYRIIEDKFEQFPKTNSRFKCSLSNRDFKLHSGDASTTCLALNYYQVKWPELNTRFYCSSLCPDLHMYLFQLGPMFCISIKLLEIDYWLFKFPVTLKIWQAVSVLTYSTKPFHQHLLLEELHNLLFTYLDWCAILFDQSMSLQLRASLFL